MRHTHWLLGSLLVGALLASPAQAKVLWRGDFETGDLSQWSKAQTMGGDRLTVVSDPVASGRHALRVRVRQGDDPINASGNRNELVWSGDQLDLEGEERFYRWQTMWPDSYQSPDTWQLFTQWHHITPNGSPPLELFARGERIFLRVDGADVWEAPLVRGVWHDFVLRVVWSTSGNKGLVELWYDGEHVLKPVYAPTLYPDRGAILKQGLYRKETISHLQEIFHDGMTVATTLEDVFPGAPPAGEEPAPWNPDEPPVETGEDPLLGRGPGLVPIGGQGAAGCAQVGAAGLVGLAFAGALVLRRRRMPGRR